MNKLIPNKFLSAVLILFTVIVCFSGCKKEKDPKERIEIKEVGYDIVCLNCKQYGSNGVLYNYNTLKFHFKFDDPKNRIKNDSYIKVVWSFDSGTSGQYLVDYSKFTFLNENVIIFNGDWNFSQTNNLNIDLTLYTGTGSKSNTLSLAIPKPVGAAKQGTEY